MILMNDLSLKTRQGVQILKLGHHVRKHSTLEEFIDVRRVLDLRKEGGKEGKKLKHQNSGAHGIGRRPDNESAALDGVLAHLLAVQEGAYEPQRELLFEVECFQGARFCRSGFGQHARLLPWSSKPWVWESCRWRRARQRSMRWAAA